MIELNSGSAQASRTCNLSLLLPILEVCTEVELDIDIAGRGARVSKVRQSSLLSGPGVGGM